MTTVHSNLQVILAIYEDEKVMVTYCSGTFKKLDLRSYLSRGLDAPEETDIDQQPGSKQAE